MSLREGIHITIYIYIFSPKLSSLLNSQPSVCSSVGSKKNYGVLWLGLGGLDVFMIFCGSTIRTERYMGKIKTLKIDR